MPGKLDQKIIKIRDIILDYYGQQARELTNRGGA